MQHVRPAEGMTSENFGLDRDRGGQVRELGQPDKFQLLDSVAGVDELPDDPDAGLGTVSVHAPGNGRAAANSRAFSAPGGRLDGDPSLTAGVWAHSYREKLGVFGLLHDTRILVVDDCTLYREYLAGAIASQGALVPGVAWDLPSLIAAFDATLPRVILLNMATRDSATLLRHALNMSAHVRVVVSGLSEDDESEIVACAEAGVAGYHLRNESLEDLLVLTHKVAAGESLCSPRVSAILLRRLSALASQRQPAAKELVLTAREIQILRMLELGLSNRDIAEKLCIAVHTVKNHVHSLLAKLGVSTRAQAAALARTVLHAEDPPRN
ncbi:response regulator transcription factor [Mycobacterium sp. 21AC1]|uniref:response regulator transcription factor n=1 Tax=[Mycobacterium] appelbergii TaxID=2939269 RepID=UPI002939280E|nr:response regulator transcription factor [Mycobacterium sp. 21AC1]MDV3128683.1 response regulator transcription factor [Mycobacterium sp. 21AC1]